MTMMRCPKQKTCKYPLNQNLVSCHCLPHKQMTSCSDDAKYLDVDCPVCVPADTVKFEKVFIGTPVFPLLTIDLYNQYLWSTITVTHEGEY